MEIKVQRLSKYGRVPTKINDSDAGWDIYASEDAIIDPSQSQLVSTDMAMAIPEGYVGLIWDRSGMAAKRGAKPNEEKMDLEVAECRLRCIIIYRI